MSEDAERTKARELGEDGHVIAETARLPRKVREKARHRQDVLRTAESLLERKSYREITIQEIASEAEFSVGYLYRLFPSKEDIFVLLLQHKHESLMAVVEENLQDRLEFEERFSNVVRAMFAWLNENMAYAASSLRDLHTLVHTHAAVSTDWLRYQAKMRERFEIFFAEAIEAGYLEEEEPYLISKTFRALMWGFIREGLLYGPEKKNWTEDAPKVVNIIMRAFAPEKD